MKGIFVSRVSMFYFSCLFISTIKRKRIEKRRRYVIGYIQRYMNKNYEKVKELWWRNDRNWIEKIHGKAFLNAVCWLGKANLSQFLYNYECQGRQVSLILSPIQLYEKWINKTRYVLHRLIFSNNNKLNYWTDVIEKKKETDKFSWWITALIYKGCYTAGDADCYFYDIRQISSRYNTSMQTL